MEKPERSSENVRKRAKKAAGSLKGMLKKFAYHEGSNTDARDIPPSEFVKDAKAAVKHVRPLMVAGAIALTPEASAAQPAAPQAPSSIEDLLARPDTPKAADDAIAQLLKNLGPTSRPRPDAIARLIEGAIDSAESPIPEATQGETEVVCLAKNMYFEAANQGADGQRAVGLVTLMRVLSGKYPKSVCGVVYQHLQFSWTLEPHKRKSMPNSKSFASISKLAEELVPLLADRDALHAAAAILHLSPQTLFYKRHDWNEHNPEEKRMSDKNKKFWREVLEPVGQIGDHVFYRLKPKTAAARN